MAPKVVRQKNVAMSPMTPGTKNNCAGEDQQQFPQTTGHDNMDWIKLA
jgi:hypothetical protein